MKSLKLVTILPRLALLTLLLPAGMLTAQNPDSAAISDLLKVVESHATQADDDAQMLANYTLSNLDWRTHANQLNSIKAHVNNLISDANQLTSLRDEGSPWQQEAIDRISVLLPEMAAHLTTTINHFNDNTTQTQMAPYRDLVLTNRTMIEKAHEMISNFVEYDKAKAKADDLERQLQLSAASETPS
ncbi:MAG: hypothetical protein ACP5E2_05665 [Terracidiphilus sp.]